MKRILVVDDDQNLRNIISTSLKRLGYQVSIASNGTTASDFLRDETYDLVITDLTMPDMSGIDLMERFKEPCPHTGWMVITAFGTVEKAVHAMREGAFDFMTKPFSLAHLESRIERYFEFASLKTENRQLKKALSAVNQKKKLVGKSRVMTQLQEQIDMVARSDVTVLVNGASGTGKELVAQAIHDASSRAEEPFLKINCAAVPDTLFESTLFGHEKGAFSGAHKNRRGIFEECDGGTLLLDEISEISIGLQAKLLRVLQEFKVMRVGSAIEVPVNVRIITTSNRDLREMVNAGNFREDLFFRLNVFPLTLPTLNERREDIPLLSDFFLRRYSEKYKLSGKRLSGEAQAKLLGYGWPGNVRELEHLLERAVLLSGKDECIEADHIYLENGAAGSERPAATGATVTLAEMEKDMIFAALEKTGGHKARAAELLGINVRTLRNKLNQYDLAEAPQ